MVSIDTLIICILASAFIGWVAGSLSAESWWNKFYLDDMDNRINNLVSMVREK